MPDFTGASLALSQSAFDRAIQDLRTGAAEIWTVFTVETSGCGFLPDRRPPILYERHIFHRLTRGAYDRPAGGPGNADGDISDPAPGGYGPSGAHQYDRLLRAAALDRNAALQSASWGLGQIMGENYRLAGFASVEDMVSSMCQSEDQQLRAFVSCLRANHLDGPLRTRDWSTFARHYNGPNYEVNRYDTKLAAAYKRLSLSPPNPDLRAAQLYLAYRGLYPANSIDGIAGVRTHAALRTFQGSAGLPATGEADRATLAALLPPA